MKKNKKEGLIEEGRPNRTKNHRGKNSAMEGIKKEKRFSQS